MLETAIDTARSADLSKAAAEADGLAIAGLITEHAADAIFLLDVEGRTTFANPAAEAMFGWSRADLVGRPLHEVIHYQYPDGEPFPMCDCALGRVLSTGESLKQHEDTFFRKDGSAVAVACSNAAIVKDGMVTGGVLIARDVGERREADRHRQLLLAELNHRIKNMISVVQSIAHQSFRGDDPSANRRTFEGRLAALSSAQSLLTGSSWASASLEEVIGQAVQPFQVNDEQFRIDGPAVVLPSRSAVGMAMAVHELSTNAAKYGALSAPSGRVEIIWRIDESAEGNRLTLTWTERGGPPVKVPRRRGFGSRMIERALAAELDGTVRLAFAPDGLVCTVVAPLPAASPGLPADAPQAVPTRRR